MRTTVEIREQQRVALAAIAAKRGLRGYSQLVQEAIDLYLAEDAGDRLRTALALRGTLSSEQAGELERRIEQAWQSWPTAS
jgi:hypothetical protein